MRDTLQSVSRYLLMIREDQPFPEDGPSGEQMHQRFVEWTRRLHEEGTLIDVGRLSRNGGRTVRRRRDLLTIDGPFAETKELVLGYFLIEARDEEQACQIAGQCPGLVYGASMEVRLMDDFPDPGESPDPAG